MSLSKELGTVSGALRCTYSGRELAEKPLNLNPNPVPSIEYLVRITEQYIARERKKAIERRQQIRESNYK